MIRQLEVQNSQIDRSTVGIKCWLTASGITEVRRYTKSYEGAEIVNTWVCEEKKILVEIIYSGQLYTLWLPAYERFYRLGLRKESLMFQPRARIPFFLYERMMRISGVWRMDINDTMRRLIDLGIQAAEKEIRDNSK
ncbi:MAG: hypothetical protein A2W93_14215 [Bacteroidetes bacterium GWF2_43_63]|nr:MAG: hypothetical protein A2W94_00785 [Bacteroidetes bacterium GWE2_42_42]OFY52495.1 MAG: hypothetical protein A2W93_14215 [Bacteroidetes bacterium GWF2_43_63]HBG71402.1 hypothetical protein [Bacteroidales bacterium]HCB60846.1 hypothetical protein [Bacteroidales bacterium]HCY23429.1 hypothetical protein [Bacteroidales bacterium]